MFRLDGDYIYRVAISLLKLEEVTETARRGAIYGQVFAAQSILRSFLDSNALGLRSSVPAGRSLLALLDGYCAELSAGSREYFDGLVGWERSIPLKMARDSFENVFRAELHVANLYVLLPKGAYDLAVLAEAGENAFPPLLHDRVPEAVDDVRQAARCLAFDLPTAAAFHAHRAHENVIKKFATHKSTGNSSVPLPGAKTPLGPWIEHLVKLGNVGNALISALRDIKDLHRNPVLHPEQSLKNSDEAARLIAAISATMSIMLEELPAVS